MKRKVLVKLICAVLIAQTCASPLVAYASPVIFTDSNEELVDASEIDEEEAIEEVNKGQKNKELADPKKTATYLYENAKENVIIQVPAESVESNLPAKFDLRDKGYVTPVKFQNPWGTCWGFAAIAACESSILSDMGKTYDETGLDLSEHHLTYFSRTYLEDGSSQDGEGIHMFDESQSLNTGGCMFTASSLFSSGVGPVDESVIPYRGKDSKTEHLGFKNYNYSSKDDWTIPSDYKFIQQYDLVESNILLSPAVYDFKEGLSEDSKDDREKAYAGYDAAAVQAMKEELYAGRAVSIAFSADSYSPEQLKAGVNALYLNTDDNKWTHYTFDGGTATHAVTIVGWDDSIKSTDFLDHSNDKYGDGLAHQPEGDGAFIVKNSWGAETEEFPNSFKWGIEDENGKATGYFYISYYDRSISIPESFRFTSRSSQSDAYMIDEYDYMPERSTQGWADNEGLQMANIFEAAADAKIREVSCQTNTENASVTYQIYLLDDEAKTPDDGELVATISDDYQHAGYHKKMLDEPISVKSGQRYSVIVTSCFSDGEDIYYEFLASTGENKEAVEEYNRKVLYDHRGDAIGKSNPEDIYANELMSYYFEGIINEGESFVYVDEIGQWTDLSQVVPYLQEYEKYNGLDFDNFSIKAYLDFDDEESAKESIDGYMTSDLQYKKPAGRIYYKYILNVLIYVCILAAIVVLIVFRIKKKKRIAKEKKEMLEKIEMLEREISELKSHEADGDI